jgi:hypothetical protein
VTPPRIRAAGDERIHRLPRTGGRDGPKGGQLDGGFRRHTLACRTLPGRRDRSVHVLATKRITQQGRVTRAVSGVHSCEVTGSRAREVATQSAEPGESGAGVTPGGDYFATAGLNPYVASIEHCLLILLWEAIKDGVLLRRLDAHRHVGHSVSREPRAQQTTESAVGGKRGHGPPAVKPTMGGEDLVEETAHVCTPTSTVARTRASPPCDAVTLPGAQRCAAGDRQFASQESGCGPGEIGDSKSDERHVQ